MPTRIQSVSLSQNSTLKSSKRFIQKRTKTVCVLCTKTKEMHVWKYPSKTQSSTIVSPKTFCNAVRYIEKIYTQGLSLFQNILN